MSSLSAGSIPARSDSTSGKAWQVCRKASSPRVSDSVRRAMAFWCAAYAREDQRSSRPVSADAERQQALALPAEATLDGTGTVGRAGVHHIAPVRQVARELELPAAGPLRAQPDGPIAVAAVPAA